MFKKLLVFVCVLALAVGVFSMTAAAQTSQDENAFKAGYAKVDINPWWSIWENEGKKIPSGYSADQIMPLPMDGYGDVMNRLSETSLTDDNGDGVIDANDGLHATCIAMRKGSNTLLLISVDMLRVDSEWSVAARQAVSDATGVPVANIMISASHTHGSIDMDTKPTNSATYTVTSSGKTHTGAEISAYRTAYTTHLQNQLVAAAQTAMNTASAATARRGTIDAGTQTGKSMNGVRHYKQTYTDQNGVTTTYVRGSNFNDDMNGNGRDPYYDYYLNSSSIPIWYSTSSHKSMPVSEADDRLHLLELTPEGGTPIVLVNWRAHATTGTKQDNHHLSSDYIGSLRKGLEGAGYRPAFFQGAAGNLGTTDNTLGTIWYQANRETYPQRSVKYGSALAEAAVALLKNTGTKSGAVVSPMATVATGEIQTMQVKHQFNGNLATYVENAAAVAHNAGVGCSRTNGTYPCIHTVQDESGANVTYAISSQYHADRIIARYKDTVKYGENWKISKAEINVIAIGRELAFVTAPFEISDRYSMNATLNAANDYNDWDALAQLGFGTPFVLSCTNDYLGYIANHLAYNYGVDGIAPYNHEGVFALGSYESQTSYVADGSGEQLLAMYSQMLTELASTITADCECCGTRNVQWMPLTREHLLGGTLDGGHYYLRENLTYEENITISSEVCLDLNGRTYTAYNSAGLARFIISSGGVLNVTDSQDQGAIVGTGLKSSVSTQLAGGTILVQAGGELNLYDGTLTFLQKSTHIVQNGGVMTVQGVFNMHGGVVEGGIATQYGGNIYVDSTGTMRMYGGTVAGGKVTGKGVQYAIGGNILTHKNATLELRGGQITGGNAVTKGQSVYSQGVLILANNAKAQIAFNAVPTDKLVIEGAYTGVATLILPGNRQNGEVIGSGNATANISNAQIAIKHSGSEMIVRLNDAKKLVLEEQEYILNIGTQRYATLQAAVDAWRQMHNPAPIKLEQAAAGLGLHVDLTVDVQLDLNGVQLGSLTVSGTGKVLCMDSTTDDYTVSGGYGTVPAGTGFQAADGYMMIDDDGIVSFHKVQNRITSINLRPSNVGLYYGSRFAGDEVVKANVAEYGIALRIGNAPTEGYITGDTEYKYHVPFDREAWVTGTGTSSSYGTLLYGIMTPGDSSNALYANANIYGATYIKTVDGQMHLSEAKVFTLKQVVETVDTMWNNLDATQMSHIKAMYNTYKSVMSSWNIPNIRTAVGETVETPETTDNTLKILAIGNSFSVDATHILVEVARAEGYTNVIVGNLYTGGCTLAQHMEYVQTPTKTYQAYYKNTLGDVEVKKQAGNWTLLQGLQDEDWDIITMQQASHDSGMPGSYESYLTNLITFVNANKTNPDAKLAWHMTWAYQADSTHTSFPRYDNNQMTMYNAIVNAVNTKVLTHSEISYIIPSGTAIQNARTSIVGDMLTRDGYHMNHLGRVITAYTWFCTLIGADQLDEVKLNAIPAKLTNYPAITSDAVLTVTEKNVIKESVNNAMKNPLQVTQSKLTQAPIN